MLSETIQKILKKKILLQIAFVLAEYLGKCSKEFDAVSIIINKVSNVMHSNRTVDGVFRFFNQSIIDIDVTPVILLERRMALFDFSYPFKLTSHVFVTPKPKYEPEIFDILQIFERSGLLFY